MLSKDLVLRAFRLMATAKTLSQVYEDNFKLVSKYVHATSRGHEAIQIAMGLQLLPSDYVYPYYRDDALLLAMGCSPQQLMLQIFAKQDDPFSGGRTYYCHPSLRDTDKPQIPHQSSATGMQAIPATGAAMGLRYKRVQGLEKNIDAAPWWFALWAMLLLPKAKWRRLFKWRYSKNCQFCIWCRIISGIFRRMPPKFAL